ncbi:MAG: hypothetical protein DRO06_03965 [Thermoproteota archaeon]|nr:MAG: hypothetical protein DRO06_03965 [Candidatus Korarchaeota archaeon]
MAVGGVRLERVPTGIPGLDEALGGGFLRPSTVMIGGHPGSGKTTLACQFVYKRALEMGERAIYAALTEPVDVLKPHMKSVGIDLDRVGDLVSFLSLPPGTGKERIARRLFEHLFAQIDTFRPKNLVIDSVTALLHLLDPAEVRASLMTLNEMVARRSMIALLLTEMPMLGRAVGMGVEEFLADGLLLLEHVPTQSGLVTRLTVIKLRGSNHKREYFRVAITSEGFEVIGPMM